MWTPFKYSEKPPQEKPAWRVEHFLGIDRSTEDVGHLLQEEKKSQ
jgi:hypothetical protein